MKTYSYNPRRRVLESLGRPETANAGLWLDKYLASLPNAAPKKEELVDEVAKFKMPDFYTEAFKRWRTFVETEETAGRAKKGYAEVIGRMAVAHGDEAVLETSVALHRTYGVPYIPGSALKGTAASFARNHLVEADWGNPGGKPSEAYTVLFGTDAVAGYITFHDALLDPTPAKLSDCQGRALHADVLTPHHSDYYMTKDNPPPPADWDNPVPVPFLSATGTYLIALSAPPDCSAWLDKAMLILKLALGEDGIGVGAKTSSGYGRLRLSYS